MALPIYTSHMYTFRIISSPDTTTTTIIITFRDYSVRGIQCTTTVDILKTRDRFIYDCSSRFYNGNRTWRDLGKTNRRCVRPRAIFRRNTQYARTFDNNAAVGRPVAFVGRRAGEYSRTGGVGGGPATDRREENKYVKGRDDRKRFPDINRGNIPHTAAVCSDPVTRPHARHLGVAHARTWLLPRACVRLMCTAKRARRVHTTPPSFSSTNQHNPGRLGRRRYRKTYNITLK